MPTLNMYPFEVKKHMSSYNYSRSQLKQGRKKLLKLESKRAKVLSLSLMRDFDGGNWHAQHEAIEKEHKTKIFVSKLNSPTA